MTRGQLREDRQMCIRQSAPPSFAFQSECHGETHRLEVRKGVPMPRDHDLPSERALMSLGGFPPPCVWWSDLVLDPRTLARYQAAVLRFGTKKAGSLALAWWRPRKEKPIRIVDAPDVFLRLAWLAQLREDLARSKHPHQDLRVGVWLWVSYTLKRTGALKGRLDVVMSEDVGVEQSRSGRFTLTRVRLSPDWFRSVLALGLQQTGGLITISALPGSPGTLDVVEVLEASDGSLESRQRSIDLEDVAQEAGLILQGKALSDE